MEQLVRYQDLLDQLTYLRRCSPSERTPAEDHVLASAYDVRRQMTRLERASASSVDDAESRIPYVCPLMPN